MMPDCVGEGFGVLVALQVEPDLVGVGISPSPLLAMR
jgi:hypothetical protein